MTTTHKSPRPLMRPRAVIPRRDARPARAFRTHLASLHPCGLPRVAFSHDRPRVRRQMPHETWLTGYEGCGSTRGSVVRLDAKRHLPHIHRACEFRPRVRTRSHETLRPL
ncbi:hypothetical protein PC116_g4441 [Phytophthora cactorum]|nr:hypothetical protein PC116_g4441 [Phytophthora cactorum]